VSNPSRQLSIVANEAPIFIVGASRSGTNLLRNILNRHPRIAISGETQFHHYVYSRRRAFGDLSDLRNRRRLVEEYLALSRLKRFIVDPAVLAERLMREATSYKALLTCLVRYYAETQGKPRYGEKTPQHAMFSGTLCEWYPGGTLIHMIRDPRDVVASLQRMPWAADSVIQNARRWLRYNLPAQRCSHLPQYLPVRYETLVTQPEQEVARICARLGEEYLPSLLDSQGQRVFPAPVPWTQRAQKPITTERLGNWREELTTDEVAQVEWVVGHHMETFGYQRAVDPPSRLTIARGIGFAAFDAVRTRLTQLPSIWYYLVRPTKLAKEESWMRRRVPERAGPRADATGMP
jgi:Sulfotransferase family